MPEAEADPDTAINHTPLHQLHTELGGRMVPFAGWELPIQYEGVIAEHTWCRTQAALFDVGHMGIIELRPPRGGDATEVAVALERLTPASITTVPFGRQRYALLTNDSGGVIDDVMVANRGGFLSLVVNASRRDVDVAHLQAALPATGAEVEVIERTDLCLLALQGPRTVDALARLAPAVANLTFGEFGVFGMFADAASVGAPISDVGISRSGYTGGDGFEIAVSTQDAEPLARWLLDQPEVKPAGLGARDTLRLEAGLCLYGNDLDETTSPVEAGLAWTVPERRRDPDDADFPGAGRILTELAGLDGLEVPGGGPSRRRVGLRPVGRRPVRDGTKLQTADGQPAGVVTSGGYGPTVGGPVAMGYVFADLATPGTGLVADVRGSEVEITVAELPFVPHEYHRGDS